MDVTSNTNGASISKEITGDNMCLKPGAIRELHCQAEWVSMLWGRARINAVDVGWHESLLVQNTGFLFVTFYTLPIR